MILGISLYHMLLKNKFFKLMVLMKSLDKDWCWKILKSSLFFCLLVMIYKKCCLHYILILCWIFQRMTRVLMMLIDLITFLVMLCIRDVQYHFTLQNILLLLGFQLLILLLMFMIRNLLLILRNYWRRETNFILLYICQNQNSLWNVLLAHFSMYY